MADQLRPVRTPLIGLPHQVANVMRAAAARGHLVDYGTLRPASRGRVAIDVTLLQPVPVRPAERPAERRSIGARGYVGVAAAVLAAGVLSALAYAVSVVVAWVAAHLAVTIGSLVLVTAAVMYGLLKGCSGVHCPGCGH